MIKGDQKQICEYFLGAKDVNQCVDTGKHTKDDFLTHNDNRRNEAISLTLWFAVDLPHHLHGYHPQ